MSDANEAHPRPGEEGDSGEKWYERLSITDVLLFLGLLLGLKISMDYLLKNAPKIAQSGRALGGAFWGWVWDHLKTPWLVWPLRLYFFFLPLCALIFWIIGFRTVAYAFAVAQMALVIATTFILTTFIRHGQGYGLFFRLMVSVSLVEFCLLSILNFFFLLPANLLSAAQMINLFGLLVALIPLAVILQARWSYGWALVYLISVVPLALSLMVPAGALRVWVGERSAYQDYGGVVTISPLAVYNALGQPTGQTLAPGDTLYVDFHRKKRVGDKLFTFRCYTDLPEGKEIYLPLLRGVNYTKLKPDDYREVVKKRLLDESIQTAQGKEISTGTPLDSTGHFVEDY